MSDKKPLVHAEEIKNHLYGAKNKLELEKEKEMKYTPEFSFYSDWSSFVFWKPMNWRDFTLINISGEIGPNRWYEIHIAFLGLHFWSQWLKE